MLQTGKRIQECARRLRAQACRCLAVLALVTLLACGTQPVLNSERIEQRFGNFGIDLLPAADGLRRSSLYSVTDDIKTTRTLAVVRFARVPDPAYAGIHARIVAGASIGASFRAAGWQVDKHSLYIGRSATIGVDHRIARLMRLDEATAPAVHVYRLDLRRQGQQIPYATIAEIHHPDYLDVAELRRLFPISEADPEAISAAVDFGRRALELAAE